MRSHRVSARVSIGGAQRPGDAGVHVSQTDRIASARPRLRFVALFADAMLVACGACGASGLRAEDPAEVARRDAEAAAADVADARALDATSDPLTRSVAEASAAADGESIGVRAWIGYRRYDCPPCDHSGGAVCSPCQMPDLIVCARPSRRAACDAFPATLFAAGASESERTSPPEGAYLLQGKWTTGSASVRTFVVTSRVRLIAP